MGNTSSQVQDEATDASQLARPRTPPKTTDEDDAAASSQLGSELQTAVALTPEKDGRERKSKKDKKRKSRETAPDHHTDEYAPSAPQATADTTEQDDVRTLAQIENLGVAQVGSPQAQDLHTRDSRKKKKKDKKAAQDAHTNAAPIATNSNGDTNTAEEIGGDNAGTKKRKRKPEEAAVAANKELSHPAGASEAEVIPMEIEKATDDQSRKKQKKSSRSSAAAAPTQVKSMPIPLPMFKPPTTKEAEAPSTRKSKRKADAAEAAKTREAEKTLVQATTAASMKEKRSNNGDEQTTKDSTKRQKKSKRTHQADGTASNANQDVPSRVVVTGVELSVIDPALLPPPQQEISVEEAKPADEPSSRKKSKRSKKSQSTTADQKVAAVDPIPATQAAPMANGIAGNPNGLEMTGERSYIEHQKKKQKRKRQNDDDTATAATPRQSQPPAAQPKSKKRKKAVETDAAGKDGSAASSSKGAGPQGTEDFPSSGPYTKKEVETLTRAIEAYRDYNNLNQVQVNDIVQAGVFNEVHGKSCKAFWDEICPALPNRWSRETIIKFVRRKWHNFDKRGKWDPEEDQMLKDAYAKTPGQWTKIGEAVGRFADDCRDRWRNYLSCSDTMASKRWHDSEVNELLNVVQDCLNTLLERLPDDKKNYWREELQSTERRDIWKPDEIRNLVRKMPDCMDALRAAFDEKHPRESKQKRATEKRRGSSATDGSVVINWDLVSDKMGKKRSRLQIMSKWKALEHSYSQDPKETFFTEANHWRVENGQKWAEQMLPGDKYNIVLAMMDLGLTNEERIIWNSVAHHELVKLKWAHQAKMTFLSMKELVPPQGSLPELLQSLKEYFEARHGNELDNHWRYEGRPGRGSLKSGTKSPGPLDWRGHMRGESSYKSSARVTDDDDDEDGNEDMKMEE